MDINEKIKKRRIELNLTLEDVANALGVARSTVLRYETKDIHNMGIDKVEMLSKVLECSPGYLMGWQEQAKSFQRVTLAAHHTNEYDNDLPEEAQEELEHLLDYLKAKYKKKDGE